MFVAICASIFFSSDPSSLLFFLPFFLSFFFSFFFFFFEMRCQPSQLVPLFSAKEKRGEKKRERERERETERQRETERETERERENYDNTKLRLFYCFWYKHSNFYQVFYKNLFLSSLTIEYPQENLWSINRKQRS